MEPDPNGIKFKGKGIERTPQSLADGLDEGLFEGPEPKEQIALALGRRRLHKQRFLGSKHRSAMSMSVKRSVDSTSTPTSR